MSCFDIQPFPANFRKSSEQASLRCATLACELFQDEGNQDLVNSQVTFTSSVSILIKGLIHNSSYHQK